MKHIFAFMLFLAMNIASAGDFDVSVSQSMLGQDTLLTIRFGGDVRSGDRLMVVDVTNGNVVEKALTLVDTDRNGQPDAIRLVVPDRSGHSLDLSVAPVDSITHSAYCDIGRHWRGSFDGAAGNPIRFVGGASFVRSAACQIIGVSTLRVDGGSVIADAALPGAEVVLSTFTCQRASDSFGVCAKTDIARQMGSASVSLASVGGNCSVLAQAIYARDRDRIIAGEEAFIRLGGYCPHDYTGVGFESAEAGLSTNERAAGPRRIRLPQSTQNWILKQVSQRLGSSIGKKLAKLLSSCEVPSGFAWFLIGNLPFGVGEAIIPCIAESN